MTCVAATAHADQTKPGAEPKADPQPAVAVGADAKPEVARAPRRDPRAAEKAKDAELLALTDDPRLGNADQIDGTEARGVVAFTFDDGPDPDTTPAVIDALQKYDVPATFFIVTRRIAGKLGAPSREILARELAAGFLVGSHTVTHPSLRRSSTKTIAHEIDQSIRTLSAEAARPIGLFRPPFGAIDGRGRSWRKKRGLTEVLWSIDTLDWQARNAERLRKKVLKMILKQDGGVVLMHDVKEITAGVIGSILDDLEAENCSRLANQTQPIVPVSLHYFVRDKRVLREIPDDVKQRTAAYRAALPARCASRPKLSDVLELLPAVFGLAATQ